MLQRVKKSVLTSCFNFTSRYAFTTFVLVTSLFVAASSRATQASSQQGKAPQAATASQASSEPTTVFGFRDFSKQHDWDQKFLAVPQPARAEQHLKNLTALPHMAGTVQDHHT